MSLRTCSIGLAGVPGQDLLQLGAHPQDLAGLDLQVGDLPHRPSPDGWWIRIREFGSAQPLARRAGREQHRGGRGGLAHADGLDVRPDELHRVVDRRQRGERATRRVDVDHDVAVGVGGLQHEQLGHHVVGRRVVDLHAEEDDALLEELVVRVGLLDAVARALDERGQDVAVGGPIWKLIVSSLRTAQLSVTGLALSDMAARLHHVVDEAVLQGLLGGEPAVAVGVRLDLLDRLAGVLRRCSSAIRRLV